MKQNIIQIITSTTPPTMPKLTTGTQCLQLLLSQVSKDMRQPILPMLFPALGAHISDAKFLYPSNVYMQTSGMMANLVADSGAGKGQLTKLVKAICRDFTTHDHQQLTKIVDWQREVKTKSANNERPPRPDVAFLFPPADFTNAAFIQNAMALEKAGNLTQYIDMPEIEMMDSICGGHKKVTNVIRYIYDCEKSGALRATADGLTGIATLRVNITTSGTPGAVRKFFKYDLLNGTFGRIVTSYKPRQAPSGIIPQQGTYDHHFYQALDTHLQKLASCKGKYHIPQLNQLINRISKQMPDTAILTDDNTLFDLSKRSLLSAWKAACIMYVLNDYTWTNTIATLTQWLVHHDLWSKVQVFGDMILQSEQDCNSERTGPKNLLDELTDPFSEAQLEALRISLGKSKDGTKNQLHQWQYRKLITRSPQTGLYTKTPRYRK